MPKTPADRDVEIIRLLFEEGASVAGLAESFLATKDNIRDVVTERTWSSE
jgi:hypothetical protein